MTDQEIVTQALESWVGGYVCRTFDHKVPREVDAIIRSHLSKFGNSSNLGVPLWPGLMVPLYPSTEAMEAFRRRVYLWRHICKTCGVEFKLNRRLHRVYDLIPEEYRV